jgi:hypothetical protein
VPKEDRDRPDLKVKRSSDRRVLKEARANGVTTVRTALLENVGKPAKPELRVHPVPKVPRVLQVNRSPGRRGNQGRPGLRAKRV